MSAPTMTPAEVLAVMDRIASFHHPIDRIEVLRARAAVAALVANHDNLLTVREVLKRECEALKAERVALRKALFGLVNLVDDSRGVVGYHPNGDTAEWDEFDVIDAARAALAGAGQ